MTPHRHAALRQAIGPLNERMRRLADLGIDLSRPGRELLADLRARRDEMARRHAELEQTQREADRLLFAELLDLYMNGDDADRAGIRGLLREHTSFRWGFGWGLSAKIATAADARNALAVLSMKDGGADYRDEIVALGHLCAAMRQAGLPLAALLGEAASWSSEEPSFGNIRSTRALLLDYAQRFST